jgi:hypothetical protein
LVVEQLSQEIGLRVADCVEQVEHV